MSDDSARQIPQAPEIDEAAAESGIMEILSEADCWTLLATAEVGRIAAAVAGEVDIFPVNYVVDDRTLVFRTAAGTKLSEVVISRNVAFEVDGYDPQHRRAWSVVCKGQATHLDTFGDIYQAQDLPLVPWNNAPKDQFVRIRPRIVTGRRFTVYAAKRI
jgi:uncharacterized protein